ncbi:MAG: 2-oxo acid dehydrogenase subunit E2 [Gemmataceae bacterium]|nr:2-oxo acid dehydrogenase subunit E2 [Gemmataceae bacterium]
MPIAVAVPRLGWTMEEGTFVGWLKADGEAVRPGDRVFQLEGDKAVEEVESLDAGVLHVPADGPKPGDRVKVGAVVGYLLQPGEPVPGPGIPACATEPTPPTAQAGMPVPATPVASPSVRRLARERGIHLSAVRGSGPAGRVTAADMRPSVKVSPRARRLAGELGIDWKSLRGTGTTGRVRERDVRAAAPPAGGVIPLPPTRRAIAARLAEGHRTTAPVTLTSLVDASNLANLRGQFQAAGVGPVPSYTDFLLKLVAAALQRHPVMAARWTDAGLAPAGRIDIGLAVDAAAGLVVPVVRGVPALGLRELTARTRDLIDRARSGKLKADELRGGCFTVTNLGAYGVDAFTPLLNPPETAVLGVGRIDRRPAVRGDEVVVREQVTLSLTFDHRVTDGGPAARFLRTLAGMVENPGPWVAS